MNAPKTRTSKPFSSSFAVEIPITPAIRRRPIIAWSVSALAGVALILHSRQPLPVMLPLVLLWTLLAAREARVSAPSRLSCRRILLRADGTATALSRWGSERLLMAPGGLILGRFAWLRFKSAENAAQSLLLTTSDLGPDGWRRLNLLWRHGLKPLNE